MENSNDVIKFNEFMHDLGEITKDSSLLVLPKETCYWLGCWNCEFKGTSVCKYKISSLEDIYGICEWKVRLIKSTFHSDKISHKNIMKDYKTAMLEKGWLRDSNQLNKLHESILKFEERGIKNLEIDDRKEYYRIKKDYDFIHNRYHTLGIDLLNLDNKDMDRDTKKEINTEVLKTFSLNDVHRIMRKDIVLDGEYKE